MPDKLDQARERILERIVEWAARPLDSTAPAHLRNLAAVYDILAPRTRRSFLPARQIDQKSDLG